MIEVHVITRAGRELRITAQPGASLMEALREGGLDEVEALCGGCCSCATCHVYVEQGPDASQVVHSADEDDLLDSSDHREANSRLSCQVTLGAEHNGIVVRIAPDD
ncbi:2Fe-2S iron-sulfur cluster-binding protein [Sphingomonas koreensis]